MKCAPCDGTGGVVVYYDTEDGKGYSHNYQCIWCFGTGEYGSGRE